MGKTMQHYQSVRDSQQLKAWEVQQHNRRVKVENMRKQVVKQKQCQTENQEQLKRVFLGYSAQMSKCGAYFTTLQPEQYGQMKQTVVISQRIQGVLLELKELKAKYDKHLRSNIYCRNLLKPYEKQLQEISDMVDALVKG